MFAIAVVAFALWIIGYFLALPRLHGQALALTALVFHYWAYHAAVRGCPIDFAPRFFVFGSGFPSVGVFLSYLLGSDISIASFPLDLISARPISALVGWIAVPVGVVLYARISGALRPRLAQQPVDSMAALFDRASDSMAIILVAGCVVTFLSWFVTRDQDGDNLLAFLVRVLMRACTFVPLAIGYYWDRFRFPLLACIVTFLAGLYFAFLTGSRGYVYLPLMLLLLGVITRQTVKGRFVRSVLFLTPVVLFLVGLGGIIGIMRDEIGRTHVGAAGEASNTQRRELARNVLETGGSGTGNVSAFENIAFRLVPWANLTVPVMAPNDVAYRGFSDLRDELTAAVSVARFTGVVYNTNFHSNDFGFYTSDTSSVEFGVIADSWSRGGLLAAIAYSGLAAFFLTALERIAKRLARFEVNWQIATVLLVFSVAWFDFSRTGLVYSLRTTVISLVILLLLVLLNRVLGRRNV